MKRGLKTALVWIVLILVVFAAVLSQSGGTRPARSVPREIAENMITTHRVESYRIAPEGLVLKLPGGVELLVAGPPDGKMLDDLAEADVQHRAPPTESPLTSMLTMIIVAGLLLLALVFFLKRMGGGTANIFELRKSKARVVNDADKARFADIGGNAEAVELLGDIVDFLKAPQRWVDAGARIPRGVLVVGPPGTGKTLLARAVAGETNASFFYTTAAELVEMFVGIGAARVRDTFEKAGAKQPAVIFIDELDAIGRRRGSGVGTIHEEREQTLNQLLVSMDGLEQRARLVVIAATNRPDVLDPALVRSGRFDRMLRLTLPTLNERVEILKIHTRNKALDESVRLEQIARQADGFTGADLEALANEASLRAVRRTRTVNNGQGKVVLLLEDFDGARESMTKSNRQFDRLDTVLVESVSQFAEPVGRALARITLTTGAILEGEVLWMNAQHIKLRTADGAEVIVAKETAIQLVPLAGTEATPENDFQPDRWSGRSLDVG